MVSFPAYPSHFLELCEHDHNRRVMLPQHSPEIIYSFLEWTLCGNVCIPIPGNSSKFLTVNI